MLFNSYVFVLIFLPAVLLFWWSHRLPTFIRLLILVVASYLFYGWWNWCFVSLLAFSTLVDYFAGKRIHRAVQQQRHAKGRWWLLLSLMTNLGLLAYFKYAGFFASSINAITDWMHHGGSLPVPEIILPAGISFYTFQTMSYSIDLYRGTARPAKSLLHFAAYVALFPQLIAGPIVRYVDLQDQLQTISNKVCWQQFARGIVFFVAGMAQKVLLADTIAAHINPLLADTAQLQLVTGWFCLLGYACQLYFDFAGYSNMAIGLGHMLGFRFPQNFDSPYRAANISEFWRKWHMTLSSWLRDYLYIPLGGNRLGPAKAMRNVIVVMLLGGLWHGAGWTFVLWGGVHGLMLAIYVAFSRQRVLRLPTPVATFVTFLAVNLAWVLFRSETLQVSAAWYRSLLGFQGIEPQALAAIGGIEAAAVLGFLLAIIFAAKNIWEMRIRPSFPLAVGCSLVLVICILRFSQESPFLYFQF